MNINIRNEKACDYSKIAEVNYEAFLGWHPDNYYVCEPVLVDLLRHNTLFDPELSIVAQLDGEIVGHALFSPFEFVVYGTMQKGVVLGPIAVLPKYQSMGIGEMLIAEGHKRAKNKGYSFSLLCGHPTYYPRFGYKTRMFSLYGCEIYMKTSDISAVDIEERPVSGDDLPLIIELWQKQHMNDNLTLFPGKGVCDWCNHSPLHRASVFVTHGKAVGYARYNNRKPYSVKTFLTVDGFEDKIIYYMLKNSGMDKMDVNLPYSQFCAKTMNVKGLKVIDKCSTDDAFMICPLDDNNGVISRYCSDVYSGKIQPGVISFTNIFDMDDGRVD